jgi:hypothetical protein
MMCYSTNFAGAASRRIAVKSKLPFARRDDTIGEKEFMMLSRRTLVGGIAACGGALATPNRAWAHAPAKRTIGLGFTL